MTYEEIKDYIENWIESPMLAGMDQLYKAGMIQGFIHGAEWAQKEQEKQAERLEEMQANLEALLQQVETLKTKVDVLQKERKQA